MKNLSPQQERFCLLYLQLGNAAKAYVEAGYSCKTPAVASAASARLMAKPQIKARIAEIQAESLRGLAITTERVMRERAKLAFFAPRGLFNDDGSPRKIGELDSDTAAALSALDVSVSGDGSVVLKYRLCDKNTALTALEKMLGLYVPQRREVAGKAGGAIRGGVNLTPEMAYAQYIEGGPLDVSALPDEVLEQYALGKEPLRQDD
jgi:phage terminase small subunit